MSSVTLRPDIQEQIDKIGTADIVIGIPSFNNASTIGHVVRAAQAGLAKYFPGHHAVIVNSDGGSSDGTPEVVQNTLEDFNAIMLQHRVQPAAKLSFSYTGIPGKGSAFRSIFEIAAMLDAKACVVVDSDLRSITPEWIELLVKPVLQKDFDYVAPLYHRHKFDGTITNSIIYPLTRSLYGKRVRQPIGGDFGFSGRLARFYLSKDVWESEVARFGIDIWMTTTAIANGFRIAQAFLGAKIHDAKDPGTDLGNMLFQVVSATFSLMDEYDKVWLPVEMTEPVPVFGFEFTTGLEHVQVNTARMRNLFRDSLENLQDIWQQVLGAGDLNELAMLGKADDANFAFPHGLWTRIVHDYALAWHRRMLPAEHLLKSLTPLYIGRTAAFVMAAENMEAYEAEADIERLCVEFEQAKPYLVSAWKQTGGKIS